MKQHEIGIKKIRNMTEEELKAFLKTLCPCDLGIEHEKCPSSDNSCDWCWRKEERKDVE